MIVQEASVAIEDSILSNVRDEGNQFDDPDLVVEEPSESELSCSLVYSSGSISMEPHIMWFYTSAPPSWLEWNSDYRGGFHSIGFNNFRVSTF